MALNAAIQLHNYYFSFVDNFFAVTLFIGCIGGRWHLKGSLKMVSILMSMVGSFILLSSQYFHRIIRFAMTISILTTYHCRTHYKHFNVTQNTFETNIYYQIVVIVLLLIMTLVQPFNVQPSQQMNSKLNGFCLAYF